MAAKVKIAVGHDRIFEIIESRLFFACVDKVPDNSEDVFAFSVDETLVYTRFFADFGPLNLGQLYRFAAILDSLLLDPQLSSTVVIFCTSHDPHKRANSAYLIGAYQIMRLDRGADDVYSQFLDISPPFTAFRDASFGVCPYLLTVLDCLRGLEKAKSKRRFDVEEYEYFEKVENGDWNWIIPGKLMAFSGPHNVRRQIGPTQFSLAPEDYTDIFKSRGVTTIVRLNKRCYDRRKFVANGFRHEDLIYPDGTCASPKIIKRFLSICEDERGAVAIHCKAGLGRTGTLIGCYLMKHHDFSAPEAIAWCRICRPGSLIGPQQQFLVQMELRMRRMGKKIQQAAAINPLVSASSMGWETPTSSYRRPHTSHVLRASTQSRQTGRLRRGRLSKSFAGAKTKAKGKSQNREQYQHISAAAEVSLHAVSDYLETVETHSVTGSSHMSTTQGARRRSSRSRASTIPATGSQRCVSSGRHRSGSGSGVRNIASPYSARYSQT